MQTDEWEVENDRRWHRLQVDGNDLVAVEDRGDGTAHVFVYGRSHPDGDILWDGVVSLDHYAALAPAGPLADA